MSTIQRFQGEDPKLMLEWSDDNGATWSNQRTASLGKVGEYQTRVKFHRLGQSRNRVFRISISDPVKRVILGAEIDAVSGKN